MAIAPIDQDMTMDTQQIDTFNQKMNRIAISAHVLQAQAKTLERQAETAVQQAEASRLQAENFSRMLTLLEQRQNGNA